MNGGGNVGGLNNNHQNLINSSRSPSEFCRNSRKYKTNAVTKQRLANQTGSGGNGETNGSSNKLSNKSSNGKHHRSVSPTSSLASSTFSNDYEDYDEEDHEKGAAYRSYSSSSSFKSDFEVDYQSERTTSNVRNQRNQRNSGHQHHHHQRVNKSSSALAIDETSDDLIEENLNRTDLELDDEIETDSIADKPTAPTPPHMNNGDFMKLQKCKNELNSAHNILQSHHHHHHVHHAHHHPHHNHLKVNISFSFYSNSNRNSSSWMNANERTNT